MTAVLVGDISVFAIESSITRTYERLAARALGFFVIYVGGRCYGVRSPEATLLACSLDAVQRRILRRGTHCVPFGSEVGAAKIVDAFHATTYDGNRQGEHFFGMSSDKFRDVVITSEIVWAPDGDAAFDDGSHVLQFDHDNRVRLIAFRNADSQNDIARTTAEVWVSADEFYGLLEKWRSKFEAEWIESQPKVPGAH